MFTFNAADISSEFLAAVVVVIIGVIASAITSWTQLELSTRQLKAAEEEKRSSRTYRRLSDALQELIDIYSQISKAEVKEKFEQLRYKSIGILYSVKLSDLAKDMMPKSDPNVEDNVYYFQGRLQNAIQKLGEKINHL